MEPYAHVEDYLKSKRIIYIGSIDIGHLFWTVLDEGRSGDIWVDDGVDIYPMQVGMFARRIDAIRAARSTWGNEFCEATPLKKWKLNFKKDSHGKIEAVMKGTKNKIIARIEDGLSHDNYPTTMLIAYLPSFHESCIEAIDAIVALENTDQWNNLPGSVKKKIIKADKKISSVLEHIAPRRI